MKKWFSQLLVIVLVTSSFQLTGIAMEDTEAPKVISYSLTDREYTIGDTVEITANIEDNLNEVKAVNLYLKNAKLSQTMQVTMSQGSDGMFRGTVPIVDGMAEGRYTVDRIQAWDSLWNGAITYPKPDDETWFEIRYPSSDTVEPIFSRIDSSTIELDDGDEKSFTIFASDDLKLKSVDATFVNNQQESIKLSSSFVTADGFAFTLHRNDFPEGAQEWTLQSFVITDLNDNVLMVTEDLDLVVTTLPKIEPVDARIVTYDESWYYETIDQDVYIMPGVMLTLGSGTVLNGNVYVGGRLRITGGVVANGEVRGNSFTVGYYTPYQDGMVVMSGSNNVSTLHASNALYDTLPFRLTDTPLLENNGMVATSGAFIPLSTLYLNGKAIETKTNGTFRLTTDTPVDRVLRFSMTDQYGKSHNWSYKVYAATAPTVSAMPEEGIYLNGETVTLTTTDGTIFYTSNDDLESFYTTPIVLDESVTLSAYAVDAIERKSETLNRRYEVISIEDVTNEDTVIRGTAEAETEVTVTVGGQSFATTANAEGLFRFDGLALTDQSAFTIQAKNGTLVSETFTRTIKDVIPPSVEGIKDDIVNEPVTISFEEGTATLNGDVISSPKTVTEDGTYDLRVVDESGNETSVQFVLDQIAPIITGVEKKLTNAIVIPTFNEGTATLNEKPFLSGTPVEEDGDYTLVVTDVAQNRTEVRFTIDMTAPDVTGVVDGIYNESITPLFTEAATLNGEPFVSGTPVQEDGDYTLVVTDVAQNVTEIRFTIDKTKVDVSGVTEDGVYQEAIPLFTEGEATLNGEAFTSGESIEEEGVYTLRVTDDAGNETVVNFTIDTTAPRVDGFPEGRQDYFEITPTFTEGEATLNGEAFTSGTTVTTEGEYMLRVADAAGNETLIHFTIDRTPVEVNGIPEMVTNQVVTPTFDEGVATLNGETFSSGQSVTLDGTYTLLVTDEAGNETKRMFTIDRTAPVVTGVTEGFFNEEVTPFFTETATLNGELFASGTVISEEGDYILVVTDLAENKTEVHFTLDRTPVMVHNLPSGLTNAIVTPVFTEGIAMLNGEPFTSGHAITVDGEYTLVVRDQAGNETKRTFTIDRTEPVVSGVSEGFFNQNVTPLFTEEMAILNGEPFESGTTVSEEGEYVLIVQDKAGNKTETHFTIDKTKVEVTGVTDGETYMRARPIFTEGTATLNGEAYSSGQSITLDGPYTLLVTDEVGNETMIHFTIDSALFEIRGLTEGRKYYRYLTPRFEKGTAMLNGQPFTSGTTINKAGKYTLEVEDGLGNKVSKQFVIDRTPPVIDHIKHRQVTNQDVFIHYNEGRATLNGRRIYNNRTVSEAGHYILRVTDQAGNITVREFTIDKVRPDRPTLLTVTDQSTRVTGRAEKGALVYITYNGQTYRTRVSSRTGIYRYYLNTTRVGATVSVKVQDRAGNFSLPRSMRVLKTFRTFTVNPVRSHQSAITGNVRHGASVRAYAGSKLIGRSGGNSRGNYLMYIRPQKVGTPITIYISKRGYQTIKKTIIVTR